MVSMMFSVVDFSDKVRSSSIFAFDKIIVSLVYVDNVFDDFTVRLNEKRRLRGDSNQRRRLSGIAIGD